MKFQLKVLAAAMMFSAATVPAQAAISTASTGDSSMVLTLVDSKDAISAVFNLGYTYSQFDTMVSTAALNGGALTWDVASQFGSTWNTFWATAQSANTSWGVYAGDLTGNGVGAKGLLMTKASIGSTSNNNMKLTTELNATITYMDKYLSANSATDSSTATVTAGSGFGGSADAYGSTGRITNRGYDSTNPLDSSMAVLKLLSGATNTASITTTTQGNALGDYSFSLSSAGVLSFNVPVAAVPEADSYAMLLAGLGVVAAVTRRRKA